MNNILILYASMTGRTKLAANLIYKQLQSTSSEIQLTSINDFKETNIADYDYLIIGSSTWDEGKIHYLLDNYLTNLKSNPPNLSGKKFAVFGCGDSFYQYFCGAVDKLEHIFQGYGATKIIPGLKLDGDPEIDANLANITSWSEQLRSALRV